MQKPKALQWNTLEYEHRERGSDWFWAVGILTVAIAITSIIFNNVLFAIVILLSGFTLALFAARHPKSVEITIDEKGVRLDSYFYPYHSLESFWVDDRGEGQHKILIKSQKLIMPYIVVPIEEVSSEEVRETLSKYLPEVFHAESNLQKLLERLGF
ncbi:MAG: hypothetical protein A3B14_02555 [Candidatus Zambryskibacteria bacterium RIFCSPLOWO2_01_FULL_45_21]|uniref:DUF5673 domain-containing protein n=1 Tax=Candidatus Zambryskibacteria bacterium RIFCSPLOWO2_01_FULL_45_21 TaxID=1802761 RepID=A0A1G2U483_9BACT|nr:MAG: hypothetical protein A3B14_02555 [Candidatus Zambryskibacteria bacterium RIFCSPLOWO2_01_FULL_45_21]